jgi:hypothetical protein
MTGICENIGRCEYIIIPLMRVPTAQVGQTGLLISSTFLLSFRSYVGPRVGTKIVGNY